MVEVIGVVPVLVAVKAGTLPVPLAAKPIAVLLLVQLKVVPATAPVNVVAVVLAPLHTTWLAGWFTVGVGFTVIVKVVGVPVQTAPPGIVYEGVTVTVAVTGVVPVLTPVNDGMLPVPLAAKPIEVLLFVHV